MKQNVGISALILAALVVAVRPTGPNPQPAQAGRPPNSARQAAASSSAPVVEGPWLATRSFFQATGAAKPPADFTDPSTIGSCVETACRSELARYFGVRAAEQVQFLIATVPDPLHSRLSLLTDSAIQAIEDAAQASGWIFATQWLPWIDSTNPDEKDPDKRRAERESLRIQEQQPGILVFRKSAGSVRKGDPPGFDHGVLLVFLAGETPTAGVNPSQFQLARAYMRAINEPRRKVGILGPTFSGSFYSLADLLKEDKAGAGYRVRSGTATGTEDGEALQTQEGVDFRGAMANTEDQERYFKQALNDLGIEPQQAALLVEDESAYGKGAADMQLNDRDLKKDQKPVRVFRFPRDISHLRDAYKDAVAASKSDSAPSPAIDFSIKDPTTGEDSIPIFSGSQSPLSQNGIVNSIANAIEREGIRLVRVDATNVLDMLFLAGVLKRQCPDTRLMLNYPDVLLVQAAHTDPLAGSLVMTSYPAFAASNRWMAGDQTNAPVTFPDSNSEGIYNATALLLNCDAEPVGCKPEASKILADYHWHVQRFELRHPPTWLLTLDRQGFLPVNVFPHTEDDETRDHWFQPVRGQHDVSLILPSPPRLWNFTAAVLGLVSLAVSVWILWISFHQATEMDARLSGVRIDAESDSRRIHILLLLLVLLAMDLAIGFPGLRQDWSTGFMVLLTVSCMGVMGVAGYILKKLTPSSARQVAWLGLAVAAAVGSWIKLCLSSPDRSLFFAFRARELRFGSSPTWPILSSLAALALFAFVHCTRFYLAACQRPEVMTAGLSLEARLRRAWKDFNSLLTSCSGFRLYARMRLRRLRRVKRTSGWADPILLAPGLAIAVAVLGVLFRVDEQVRTIDGGWYNWLALILQIVLAILLLLACVQIRLLWRSLESFLASVASLPLVHAFKPVDGSGTSRPIWVRRLNLQSMDVHIQSVYVLHNMVMLAQRVQTEDPAQREFLVKLRTMYDIYRAQIAELLKIDRKRAREDTRNLMKAMRIANKWNARRTFAFLRTYWAKFPLVSPEQADSEKAGGPGDPLDELAGLAQRFVALHYSSFILYGVRQIQNLLVFVSSGFVLLMISLNCYSIQAPQFTGRLLLLLFVIIGATTFSCLAGLERDTILSRMGGNDPGKFNSGFFLKIAAYGGLPALSLLASEFPSISNFLLSWVEPTLEAFK